MAKTLSDVLEYLYQNDEKELAEAVLEEMIRKQPLINLPVRKDGNAAPLGPYFHEQVIKTPSLPRENQVWCGTTSSSDSIKRTTNGSKHNA